jgi:hypothetical protein
MNKLEKRFTAMRLFPRFATEILGKLYLPLRKAHTQVQLFGNEVLR